jgi:hypothetical protein
MRDYYFLITALPPLYAGKPEISFQELEELFELNLSEKDQEKVALLLRPIDLYNVKAFWLGLPLDPRGRVEVEEALVLHSKLPEYAVDFLARYDSVEERLKNFASLYASFYREEEVDGFLKKYFELERSVRLILTALRAKAAKRDVVKELQFEDPTDLLVADILAQKDAAEYNPPQEFEDLKMAFLENSGEPVKLNKAVLRYRLSKIDEMIEPQDFTIDWILAYTARLLLLEDVYGRKD